MHSHRDTFRCWPVLAVRAAAWYWGLVAVMYPRQRPRTLYGKWAVGAC